MEKPIFLDGRIPIFSLRAGVIFAAGVVCGVGLITFGVQNYAIVLAGIPAG